MKVKFTIPGHPPSVNNLFLSVGRRRVKSPEYRSWELTVAKICRYVVRDFEATRTKGAGRAYALSIVLVADTWMTKNGKIRKPDTPNLIKSAEDAICAVYGWEDSFNISTTIRKAQEAGAENYTLIEFEFL